MNDKTESNAQILEVALSIKNANKRAQNLRKINSAQGLDDFETHNIKKKNLNHSDRKPNKEHLENWDKDEFYFSKEFEEVKALDSWRNPNEDRSNSLIQSSNNGLRPNIKIFNNNAPVENMKGSVVSNPKTPIKNSHSISNNNKITIHQGKNSPTKPEKFSSNSPQITKKAINQHQPQTNIVKQISNNTTNLLSCAKPGKKFDYHRMKIIPFLVKKKLHEDTIVFIYTTGDEYMRRAFLRRGWVENTIPSSFVFDFRWDLNENSVDFEQLRSGQLCNHFPNNQELTTKTGLTRNLSRLMEYGCDSEAFFPRCYDFTDEKQIDAFLEDYNRTAIVNLIKKHASYFKSVHGKELKEISKKFKNPALSNQARIIYKGKYMPFIESTRINLLMLKCALSYLENQIKLRTEIINEHQCENTKWHKKCKQLKNCFETLISLSQYNLPYTTKDFMQITELVQEGWEYPNLYLEYKTVDIIRRYKKVFPQAKIEGCKNIWIVKPSFSSRGIGVHCIDAPKDEFERSKKMQAKVVQKYIERPFLLKLPGPNGKLEKRKFDFRQWVLVTSMSPLIIYMFNSCYLKICGSEFVLDEFKDKYRHISNFSVQKGNARIGDINNDLIMSVPQFVQHLWENYEINLNWEKDMFPKLAKIAKDAIYSGWDVIEHRQNSFELFGLDYVLDENLNPWLIEVNLSPACCERTDWLIDMLRIFCYRNY